MAHLHRLFLLVSSLDTLLPTEMPLAVMLCLLLFLCILKWAVLHQTSLRVLLQPKEGNWSVAIAPNFEQSAAFICQIKCLGTQGRRACQAARQGSYVLPALVTVVQLHAVCWCWGLSPHCAVMERPFVGAAFLLQCWLKQEALTSTSLLSLNPDRGEDLVL